MIITVKKDLDLDSFTPWSGARETMDTLGNIGKAELVWNTLAETHEEEDTTETEINDFFWFERDTIAQWLGFTEWDEVLEVEKKELERVGL